MNGEEHVVEKTGEMYIQVLLQQECQLLKHMDWLEWDQRLVLCYFQEKKQQK